MKQNDIMKQNETFFPLDVEVAKLTASVCQILEKLQKSLAHLALAKLVS